MSLVISNSINIKDLRELETKVNKITENKAINKTSELIKSNNLTNKIIKEGKEAVEKSENKTINKLTLNVKAAASAAVGRDKANRLIKIIEKSNNDYNKKKGVNKNKKHNTNHTLKRYGLSKKEINNVKDNCLSKSPESPSISYLNNFTSLKPSKTKDKTKDCVIANKTKKPNNEEFTNKIVDKLKNGSLKTKDILTAKSSNSGCDWNIKSPDLGKVIGGIKFDLDIKDYIGSFNIVNGTENIIGGLKDAINNIAVKMPDTNIPNINLPDLNIKTGNLGNINLPDLDYDGLTGLIGSIDLTINNFINCKNAEPTKTAEIISDDSVGSEAIRNKIKKISATTDKSVFKVDKTTTNSKNVKTLKKAFSVTKNLVKNNYTDKGIVELATTISKNKVVDINNGEELNNINLESYDKITILNKIVKNNLDITNQPEQFNKNIKHERLINILA